jgi:hypothetical protein
MKIVVVGGSGLIGSKVVAMLRHDGHDVLAASRRSGVDVVSGEGLTDAVQGASVVVDVTNAPSFEDAAVMKFFKTSTHNLLTAEAAAGVVHHVALSVVGCRSARSAIAPALAYRRRLQSHDLQPWRPFPTTGRACAKYSRPQCRSRLMRDARTSRNRATKTWRCYSRWNSCSTLMSARRAPRGRRRRSR